MAWTNPRDWVIDETVTAALMNAHIRDNLKFLHNPDSVGVYKDAVQAVNESTWTEVTFNQENWDTNALHDVVTNNARLTCVIPGLYLISGYLSFSAVPATMRGAGIYLNGATYVGIEAWHAAVLPVVAIQAVLKMSATDYVTLHVYQNNGGGGALNITAGAATYPQFSMTYLGSG